MSLIWLVNLRKITKDAQPNSYFITCGNQPVYEEQEFFQNSCWTVLSLWKALYLFSVPGQGGGACLVLGLRINKPTWLIDYTHETPTAINDTFRTYSYSSVYNFFRAREDKKSPTHRKFPQRPQQLTTLLEQEHKETLGLNFMTLEASGWVFVPQ